VNGTGSGSCPVAGFVIGDVEPSGSASITYLAICFLTEQVRNILENYLNNKEILIAYLALHSGSFETWK
jgi:hypothetical protein